MQHPGTWYLPWGMPLQKMVAVPLHPATGHLQLQAPAMHMQPMLAGLPAPLATLRTFVATQPTAIRQQPQRKILCGSEKDKCKLIGTEKRKADDGEPNKDLKKVYGKPKWIVGFEKPYIAKLETKALKAKRPGFTDDRYNETSYYIENGLRKVYPYYFTFTTFTKGRWVGERILDVFAREFRAHPAEEYERCIQAGTLTVNYEKVPTDYKLKHNDLLANVVHRHETPVLSNRIRLIYVDEDIVVLDKPCSLPVHPCGRYRHNTVVFILAKEYNLKNLRTIHRLDRLTSGLLLFGRSPKKARQMEHQIRNRLVTKEYVCRVEGEFPDGVVDCKEPIEVVSYKIGVCKVSQKGKDCSTTFQKLGFNGKTSIVLCKPKTGRMHQIRVHLQYLGYPVVNDPLYNHEVFGPLKGKGGDLGGKTDEELVRDLIHIHNAENWLGMDGDSELSMFNGRKVDLDDSLVGANIAKDDDADPVSREPSPCEDSRSSPVLTTSPFMSRHVIDAKVTVATQTGHEAPDFAFNPEKMTVDQHCYECKVRYRDPKPQDLVMYLHAWKYRGPGWEFETELPDWARVDWVDTDISE
ncbi:pseudouridylate synthase RPUSD2-like isoform X2 [Anthonomus grandis grandis]|uniref:pseudouridylate synthase RPUSD2-like isoform X2 n=1 Tax=Anthonomus grandis grandis TaxID=2921223 RepID=UPI002165A7D3|nr:pseudouridylate synthase RPUSD2-like isoform X2 [Anthonomus grandis grandis]